MKFHPIKIYFTWAACLLLIITTVIAPAPAVYAYSGEPPEASAYRAEVLVLVNSESSAYADFAHWIQPYLENFGVPYRMLDLAKESLPGDLGRYAEVLIGHARLDPAETHLDRAAQQKIIQAVKDGTGLVNFDNDLADSSNRPRYPYIQELFGFSYGTLKTGRGVRFDRPAEHYITALHTPNEQLATANMRTGGFVLPAGALSLAATWNGQPFLSAAYLGEGRAVQWASYDWISDPARGPLSGLDDLVWRSIVWAARKPFVMQALPPFVTMRVDDVSGPLGWAHTVSEQFPLKPWIGVFIHDFSTDEARDLSKLVRDGKATAFVHSFNMRNFFYADHLASHHNGANLPDALEDRNFFEGMLWHTQNAVPLSSFTVGHYYEMSINAFQHLAELRVPFIGTLMEPGQRYGAPWVQEGPYRLYSSGSSKATRPFYYADYVKVPGHPEWDGKFFNCMTEIRDDAGYEWFPGPDVQGSIERGVRQTERALNSLVLATLFTHEYHIKEAGPQKWPEILKGVTQKLAADQPIYVTLDQACQYVRAIHDSKIISSAYNPEAHVLVTSLQGSTDIPTTLSVFTETKGQIERKLVNVPVIQGIITDRYSLP